MHRIHFFGPVPLHIFERPSVGPEPPLKFHKFLENTLNEKERKLKRNNGGRGLFCAPARLC